MILSWSPKEIPFFSFLINPWKFHIMLFAFDTPGNSISSSTPSPLNPRVLFFVWFFFSGIAHCDKGPWKMLVGQFISSEVAGGSLQTVTLLGNELIPGVLWGF